MLEEQDPVYQRLNFIVAQLEAGNQADFARRIGVRSGVVGDMFGKRKNKPSFDVLAKIAGAYPQLRVEWLLLGEGEMLKKPSDSTSVEKRQNISSYEEFTNPHPAVQYITPPGAGENSINPGLQVGKPANVHGMAVPTYNFPATTKKTKAPAAPLLPGLDLLQMVAQQQEDIATLKRMVRELQQQLATLPTTK